jgi:adenylyltransferase/sulfurtransferase
MMSDILDRNSRTILLNDINFEGYLSIANSNVLIVGAGGISSSVISLLSAGGVRQIAIWEDDTLELSNLQRQFIYKEEDVGKLKAELACNFAKGINSNLKTVAICKKLTSETLQEFTEFASEYNVIVDGTDNFSSRFYTNKVAVSLGIPLFTGSAIGFEGQVYSFFGVGENLPCYSCLYGTDVTTFNDTKTCSNSGVFPPIPSIIGSIISQNVLGFLANKKGNFTKFILIDFTKQIYFKEITMNKDRLCSICKI